MSTRRILHRYESNLTPSLPSDEYAALRGRHKLEMLYEKRSALPSSSHSSPYASPTSSGPSHPRGSSNRSSSSHEQRLKNSEIRYATRKALGPNLNFDDESFYDAGRRSRNDSHGPSDLDYGHDKPIPKRYLDEFNRRWHEDDEDKDADQYMADVARHAPWRQHQPIYTYGVHKNSSDVVGMMKQVEQYQHSDLHSSRSRKDGHPTVKPSDLTSPANSRFSWDDSDDEDERNLGKSLFGHRTRPSMDSGYGSISRKPLGDSFRKSLRRD